MAASVSIAEHSFPAKEGQAFPLDNFQQLLAYSHVSLLTFTHIKEAGSSSEIYSQGPKLPFPFHERETSLIKDTD